MINDPKLKARFKLYLILGNVALGLILVSLVIYWLTSIRTNQIKVATELNQYRSYSMSNLPGPTNEIEADYVGNIYSTQNDSQKHNSSKYRLNEDSSSLNMTLNKEPKYSNKPKISIIVTNLGLNKRSTELALTLPSQCGLGFVPYIHSLKHLLLDAKNKGHEIYLYLPLQTNKIHDEHSKYALMNNLSAEDNAERLNVILNLAAGYKGLYSACTEIYTYNKLTSKVIFDQLNNKNLIFIMGRIFSDNEANNAPTYKNVISSNIIIDEKLDKNSILSQLDKLLKNAKNNGKALGYAQSSILTIEMIRDWLPILDREGISLVPVSELLREYNS